jgi:hypothetical protein
MDEIKLPQHVVDRVEPDGRLGSRSYWKASRGSGGQPVPLQSPQVRRLLEGSSLPAAEVGRNARPLPGLTGPGSSRKQGPGGGRTAASSPFGPFHWRKPMVRRKTSNPKPPLPALSAATKQRAAVVAVTCRSS